MQEIESAGVLEMQDVSASDLLAELNDKQKKIQLRLVTAIVFALLVVLAIFLNQPNQVIVGLALTGLVVAIVMAAIDRRRRTVVLLYDLEPEIERACREVHEAFDAMNKAQRKWHVSAKGNVRDIKYHAGASTLVKRQQINFSSEPPKNVKTNVSVPTIPVGRQVLCFFPDRLLVFDHNAVGAVAYRDLNIEVDTTRFVEDEKPPRDSEVVDWTWQYVNKRGGPDRRFKNNKKLPVVLYDDVFFLSNSGLRECVQLSLVGPASKFATGVKTLLASR